MHFLAVWIRIEVCRVRFEMCHIRFGLLVDKVSILSYSGHSVVFHVNGNSFVGLVSVLFKILSFKDFAGKCDLRRALKQILLRHYNH